MVNIKQVKVHIKDLCTICITINTPAVSSKCFLKHVTVALHQACPKSDRFEEQEGSKCTVDLHHVCIWTQSARCIAIPLHLTIKGTQEVVISSFNKHNKYVCSVNSVTYSTNEHHS